MTPVRKPCFANAKDSMRLQLEPGEHRPGLDFD